MASEESFFGKLPASGEPFDEACVHSIRKGTKRLRACLELQRALEGQLLEMKELRQSVKRLARMLADQRDADVMADALRKMQAETEDSPTRQLLVSLSKDLESAHLTASDNEEIRQLLGTIETGTAKLLNPSTNPEAVERLLETRLSALHSSGQELLDSRDWDALHDWRKLAKKLMYQFQLKRCLSKKEKSTTAMLEELGHSLGNLHDLCILEDFVQSRRTASSQPDGNSAYARILTDIAARQEQELAQFRKQFNDFSQLL